jgi:hypothetical protein
MLRSIRPKRATATRVFETSLRNLLTSRYSLAAAFRWIPDRDIVGVQTKQPAPMSDTLNPGEHGRFSAPREAATVLRLLRGESPELLALPHFR